MVKYNYNAWGNCTVCNSDGTPNTSSTFIGNITPFRYRGYYWDKDLGLYYLHSRYYAPWETFADILGGINQRYGNPIPQQQIKNAWVYYAMSTIFFPLTVFYWI